jgi:4-hydroxy-tetrahydrodipicolinate synthase
MKFDLKGVITPVVTVFNEDESIDESGYRQIVKHLLDHGVYGIFTCGGQGEGHALAPDERLRLLELTIEEVDGKVPVLIGTGAPTTRASINMTKAAKENGADIATIINPFYISPNQDELYKHYCDIIDAVDIPVIIYNNPWRTHSNIQPDTVAKICEYSPNLVGIKDSSGDLSMTLKYKAVCPDNFSVFIGRDQLILSALLSGIDGAVAATSNAAIDIVVGIYNDFVAGDLEAAWDKQNKLVPLREYFSAGTFPVTVKEAMMMQGLPAGPCRKPVGRVTDDKRKLLKGILTDMGLL